MLWASFQAWSNFCGLVEKQEEYMPPWITEDEDKYFLFKQETQSNLSNKIFLRPENSTFVIGGVKSIEILWAIILRNFMTNAFRIAKVKLKCRIVCLWGVYNHNYLLTTFKQIKTSSLSKPIVKISTPPLKYLFLLHFFY